MSTTVDAFVRSYQFNRGRTLALLDEVEKLPDPQAVLGWRPGPGRAHVAWQLMHVGVTEEVFATERLAPRKSGRWAGLWPRFRGGSTPDDDVPAPALIRQVLADTRGALLETLVEYGDERLGEVPPSLAERGWTVRDVLCVIAFHEAHHQGQAHLTLNLWRARQPAGA